jgi:general secretion pathway protein C
MKLADAIKNPIPLLTQEIFLRRATVIVNFILVCLLTYVLAELTWKVLPGPTSLTPPPAISVDRNSTTHNTSSVESRDITKWHLFGIKETKEPIKPDVAEIPETKLKLVLRGIFASDDPTSGGAIIADPRNEENFYTVGSQVPGNATLKEIYPDRVVLMRNNQFETLRLPKESVELNNGGPVTSSRQPAAAPPPSPATSTPTVNSGASLREYRDSLVSNPQQIANLIQIEPVNDAGQFIGYRVQPGADSGFFTRFGLQPGDVVTSVNGITLDTPAKGLNLLRSLPDTNQYTIDVLRNGQMQSFVVNIDD